MRGLTWLRKRRDGAVGFSWERFNACFSSKSSRYYDTCKRRGVWRKKAIYWSLIEFEIKITCWAIVSLTGACFGNSKVKEKVKHQGGKEKNHPSHLQQPDLAYLISLNLLPPIYPHQFTTGLWPAKIFVTIFVDSESECVNVCTTCLDVVDYLLLGHLFLGRGLQVKFTLLQWFKSQPRYFRLE